ncbi:hypothetical protein [Burkholderia anthina]|uniref:hypothetical protein n=1 Tax=Burkholderia anthina TaxID=179879 RepID=UPI00158D0FB7|nr:hypothetical protein [Burkholderia anthina]
MSMWDKAKSAITGGSDKTIEQAIKAERQERKEQGGTFFDNKAEDQSAERSAGGSSGWAIEVDAPRIGSPAWNNPQLSDDPYRTTFDANGNPTSRAKISEAALSNRRGEIDGDSIQDVFSTHRAERSSHPEEVAKRAKKRKEQKEAEEARAWRGFIWLTSLGKRT